MIIWLNQRGVLVDPPAFSTEALHKIGVPPAMIDKIILTECNSDNDCGIIQKVLSSSVVEIITTPTIMACFLKKYSAILGLSIEEMRKLFEFRPVTIGYPLGLYGAIFTFGYTFHSVPSIYFSVKHLDHSIFFSGKTLYNPTQLKTLYEQGVIGQSRLLELTERNLESFDYVFHEASKEQYQTSFTMLADLPLVVKEKLLIFGTSEKSVDLSSLGLVRVDCGLSNTIVVVFDTGHNNRKRERQCDTQPRNRQ